VKIKVCGKGLVVGCRGVNEMYRTIVVDCQTKTGDLYCEDCIFKKLCLARLQHQKPNTGSSLDTAVALEVTA